MIICIYVHCALIGETKVATMSLKDAVKHFSLELLDKLPLDNMVFLTTADTSNLFPPGVKANINAKSTNANKVAYYLDHVVNPGADQYLPKLLDVMSAYNDLTVQQLAREIRKAIGLSKYNYYSKRIMYVHN